MILMISYVYKNFKTTHVLGLLNGNGCFAKCHGILYTCYKTLMVSIHSSLAICGRKMKGKPDHKNFWPRALFYFTVEETSNYRV